MRRIHITYIIGSLGLGGAEGQLLELLRHIDRRRYSVSLVLFDASASERVEGLADSVFSLQIGSQAGSKSICRGLKAGAATLRLTRHLRRLRPDIVHAILPASCILAAPATRLAGVPVFIAARRSLVGCYRSDKLLSIADRTATRCCNYAIGNSKAIRRELIEIDGLHSHRVGIIYNGVDTCRFRPGNRDVRKRYGWTDEHVVFGIVANFIPYKRHADFIRSAGIIAESNANARFVMVGEDRGILDALKCQVHESGLDSLVTIIPGVNEPEQLYPALDVYVCTSETEGLSNVLLEAGACGLPIIATSVGGNSEVVDDGHNGFLVPVAMPDAIAAKGLRLSRDAELRTLFGAQSRRRAVLQFSLSAMVEAHERLYKTLLSSEASREASNPMKGINAA